MAEILYEDDDLIVVWKPVGMESQSSRGFAPDMVSELRRHIHNSSPKGVEPYVGVIHRLDKPVSGVMVYAKTKKAAASLSRQVAQRTMKKKYLAVVCGKAVDKVDNFVDYLLKDEKSNTSRIVDKWITGGKEARLSWRGLAGIEKDPYGPLTLVEIELDTGRHHQIRVQMAGHGLPLWGDQKYHPHPEWFQPGFQPGFQPASQPGSQPELQTGIQPGARRGGPRGESVALSSYSLSFVHPITKKTLTFSKKPESQVFSWFQ